MVAAVALAAGCGSGRTTVGTSSVPDPGSGDTGGTSAACSTTPVAIATDLRPMATDGSFLYGWGTQQIARVPVGGGAPATVVGGIDIPVDLSLLVDDRFVYWSASGQVGFTLFRAPKSGGGPPTSLSDSGATLVADAGYVYSIAGGRDNGSGVTRVAKADGQRLDGQVARGGSAAAVDGSYVYWTTEGDRFGDVAVARLPKTLTGSVELIAHWTAGANFGAAPFSTAFDEESLFVWDSERILRVDLAGGAVRTLAIASGDRAGAMAVDDEAVYWVMPRHVVARVNKDGGGAATLFESSNLDDGLVVAGDSVYFGDGGTLYRRCKR